jgi:hypothetical protein
LFCAAGLAVVAPAPAQSIAREWNEQILAAIRLDTPHPPAQARNLFSLSAAMYDAWAAYDGTAVGYVYRGKHSVSWEWQLADARREAISFAAWRLLKERYALSRNAATTLAALDAHMAALGYDTNNVSRDTSTSAGVGNAVYDAVSAWFINDGSRQTASPAYSDYPTNQGGYVGVNGPVAVFAGGVGCNLVDMNYWQALSLTNLYTNCVPAAAAQGYLGAHWLGVRPFALERIDATQPWINPGPPPRIGTASDAAFKAEIVYFLQRNSELTPDDGVNMDICPGGLGNNSLGANDGTGHPLNPATGLPYALNIVKRGDYCRVLAEFWADGPNSETPPGHWNLIANFVADHPGTEKRIGGIGPVVDDLEWDVKVYFALNAAVHDAACACWSVKRTYNSWRPLSAVRAMGALGQCSDYGLPSYHTNGLPLVPGLIELVTPASSAAGQRHQGLPVNAVAIRSWPGPPAIPASQHSGVKWIAATNYITFQRKTFVTPAFPGYSSDQSMFSRSAAEVLTGITGTGFFPGGLYTVNIPANTFVPVEVGPSAAFQLQWGTYYDAADSAGMSCLWGGIHPRVDDLTSRVIGSQVGSNVWALSRAYFDGSVIDTPMTLAIRKSGSSNSEVRVNTMRGFYYKLQSKTNIAQAFTDEGGAVHAVDSSFARTNASAGPLKIYRAVRSLTP